MWYNKINEVMIWIPQHCISKPMSWTIAKCLPEATSPCPMTLERDEKSTAASIPLKMAAIPSTLNSYLLMEIRLI